MNKSETREVAKLSAYARSAAADVGILARSFSALVRAARTTRSRNEILTAAAGWPAVVAHSDFIV